MDEKKLGNSNLKTPPIAFGGNVFGWTLNEKESFRMLDELLERGFHYLDTADVYSRWAEGNEGGESERIIGKWMKDRRVRDKITLVTKVGSDMGQGEKDLSKDYILKAVEKSLKRLQTGYIDLYFTHWDDEKTPVEETLSAYQELIEQGKVRYVGASNLSPERLQESLLAAKNQNLPKYEVFQPEYNLIKRDKYEGKIQDICLKNNLGVTSYFSLASGFLTGKYRNKSDFEGQARKEFVQDYFTERNLAIVDQLEQIAEQNSISIAGAALAWIMEQPGITAPIVSATKSKHLKSFEEAIEVNLTQEEIDQLTMVSE